MMQEFKGMMLLYTEQQKNYSYQCLYSDDEFDTAHERAVSFIGEHNPVDGCSTEPQQGKRGEEYWYFRGTSFGERRAYITRVPVISGK